MASQQNCVSPLWPEFTYSRKWECDEDFMAVQFYPRTEGKKAFSEKWNDKVSARFTEKKIHGPTAKEGFLLTMKE
jgi:hypothetical protein